MPTSAQTFVFCPLPLFGGRGHFNLLRGFHGRVCSFLRWVLVGVAYLSASQVMGAFGDSDHDALHQIYLNTESMDSDLGSIQSDVRVIERTYMPMLEGIRNATIALRDGQTTNIINSQYINNWISGDGFDPDGQHTAHHIYSSVSSDNGDPLYLCDALVALSSLNPDVTIMKESVSGDLVPQLGIGQLFYGYDTNSYIAASNSIHRNGIFYNIYDIRNSLRQIAQTATNIAFYVSSPPWNYLHPNYTEFASNHVSWLTNADETAEGYGSSLNFIRDTAFKVPGMNWVYNINDFNGLAANYFMNDNFGLMLDDYSDLRALYYYYYGNGQDTGTIARAISLINANSLADDEIPDDEQLTSDTDKQISTNGYKQLKYESIAPDDYTVTWLEEAKERFLRVAPDSGLPDKPDMWETLENGGLLGYEFSINFTGIEGESTLDVKCDDLMNFAQISPTLEKIKDFNNNLIKIAKYLVYFGLLVTISFKTLNLVRNML